METASEEEGWIRIPFLFSFSLFFFFLFCTLSAEAKVPVLIPELEADVEIII